MDEGRGAEEDSLKNHKTLSSNIFEPFRKLSLDQAALGRGKRAVSTGVDNQKKPEELSKTASGTDTKQPIEGKRRESARVTGPKRAVGGRRRGGRGSRNETGRQEPNRERAELAKASPSRPEDEGIATRSKNVPGGEQLGLGTVATQSDLPTANLNPQAYDADLSGESDVQEKDITPVETRSPLDSKPALSANASESSIFSGSFIQISSPAAEDRDDMEDVSKALAAENNEDRKDGSSVQLQDEDSSRQRGFGDLGLRAGQIDIRKTGSEPDVSEILFRTGAATADEADAEVDDLGEFPALKQVAWSSESASYIPTPDGRSEADSIREGSKLSLPKSKTSNGRLIASEKAASSQLQNLVPQNESPGLRKGKKAERIEVIEDGSRIIVARQNSRSAHGKGNISRRGQHTKSVDRNFLRNGMNSTRQISSKFFPSKPSFAPGKPAHSGNVSEDSEYYDDDEYEYEESDFEDDDSLANFQVRLEDGSLSEGSFVRVASEYELEDNLFFENSEPEPKVDSKQVDRTKPFPHKASRMLSHMERITTLDCIVRLLAGTKVTKRLRFKRLGERWIYLGNDLATLNWRSSKRSKDIECLILKRVRKLQIRDRLLKISTRTYSLKVLLETRDEAKTWLTGLVRVIPSSVEVLDGRMLVAMPSAYDPLKDSWRGKALKDCKRINEYVLLGNIGHGSFGKVKLALSVKDKKFFAVKIIAHPAKLKRLLLPSEKEAAARLKRLSHANIVKHKDILYHEEKQKIVFVLEYMSRGVLQDCSKLEHNKPMSEDQVREHVRDVVSGLLYLHKQGIVHRDIKPANLLRSGDGRVKISDFGEAKYYNLKSNEDKENTGVPGTPAFLAPEFCVSAHCPRGNASQYAVDVWSLGASIYYLVFGSVPFIAKSILAMYDAICTEELKFPEEPKVSRALKDLLKAMLTKSPQKRVDMQGVAEHPWFGSLRPTPPTAPIVEVSDDEVRNAVSEAHWIYPER
uniref:Protein kinase domain-containing protein n=1 Tax=Rhodosorus marinus TaxID=101924 RepID=A0A7S3EEY5_9RHOD|mmetsp:Transcript_31128/g.119784  ORF Transcript_31128/g.119784 Transcript_31128/m.119784 type:complete len:977 (+) Transcript_31128:512-3442(+)